MVGKTKRDHNLINIFSNFNISKKTYDRKIGDQLGKSNDSKRIRIHCESPETMQKLCLSTKFPHQAISWNYGILGSDSNGFRISQNVNSFASVQKYRLKNHKKHCNRTSNFKFYKELNDRGEEVITSKIHMCLISETKVDQFSPN